jgi:uncharacterized protein (DUF1499 family)
MLPRLHFREGFIVETQSRVAVLAQRLGLAGLALVVLGPMVNHVPGVPPMAGFAIFALGLLDGLVAIVLGAIALVITRPGSGVEGRGAALMGLVLGAGMLALIFVVNSAGMGGPRINDITTDTEDPPTFVAIAARESGRDYAYPGAAFASEQQRAYPDVGPIQLDLPPGEAFAAVRRAAESLGWEIVAEDAAGGTLEAMQTTAVFRFVDDVVVRVRPEGSGSRVDVRSKSRDGKGDVGANAARIRAFGEALAS